MGKLSYCRIAAAMAFYVMHDTFITQQRTNYFPKKVNSDREKERSDTKVHFRNNHANISGDISKKLNNNNEKIKEGIAELTQSRVMNDKTTAVKENQLDVQEESFLTDKNKNININQLNEDNNSNIHKIEHLNKNTLQTNFVWKQMDESVKKEDKE